LAHYNTVFSQLLKLVSRHEFETLAKQHHEGQKLRKMSRWSQFVALSLAQLSGRSSLRDIVSNLSAQAARLYHLGAGNVTRSTLSRVNESQPYTLYEALFHKLLSRCHGVAPKHGFRFGNKLYSLDSTTIDLCLSVFPWAKFRRTKGAVKVHVGLDHDGLLPSFVSITDGKKHDVTIGRVLEFPADSIVVMDRAYTDYSWFNALNDKGIFFVIRQKRNATYRIIERRDVIKSTNAALDYLQKLSNRFDGDWLLALASYNAGGGTVSRAIRRNEEAGKPTDFWSLKLPRETTAYVPKLLAIAQIVQEPGKYEVALHPIRNEPYFEQVDTGGQIDLAQAARLADISVEELYLLNPSYNRWATSPDGPHRLLIPVERADNFRTGLAALPADQRMQWARYEIQPGDNLGAIARRYRTTPQALRSINHLKGNTIIAGRTLLIPGPAASSDSYTLSADARLAANQGRERNGRTRLDYTVRSGDTLWAIARSHDVGVKELARWNNMAPGDSLSIGQSLAIWAKGSQAASPASRADDKMVRKVRYAVRNGDSLYAIADRFNVSVNDIKSWNQTVASNRYIQPGQRLTLYVDIRQSF